ncbi:hypothetical protein B0I37DRAFT_386828 [Chaetomium sp. MPI-CAGE-AT-0009]|nr:hypothetical protein B0I37DRAFT_386828 [Chaetomium sp. MPI-CAGE-AT-0009]
MLCCGVFRLSFVLSLSLSLRLGILFRVLFLGRSGRYRVVVVVWLWKNVVTGGHFGWNSRALGRELYLLCARDEPTGRVMQFGRSTRQSGLGRAGDRGFDVRHERGAYGGESRSRATPGLALSGSG